MATKIADISRYLERIERASTVEVRGRVREVVGLVVKAVVPDAWIGEMCLIRNPRSPQPVKAEVVGFRDGDVLLMPLGDLVNIGPHSEVIPTGNCLTVKVGDGLLGRVLDGLGEPMDADTKGPLGCDEIFPVLGYPPDPLKRQRVTRPISLGVRAIDAVLTAGEGQRIGLFAAAGGGKSTLLGMIARNTEADVNVITLVGERGREVRDFIEHDLGPEGIKRSVVVCATSNESSLVRLKAAYVGTAIAEYFPRQGQSGHADDGLGDALRAGAARDRIGMWRASGARGIYALRLRRTARSCWSAPATPTRVRLPPSTPCWWRATT